MITRYIKSGELIKVTNKSTKNGYVLIFDEDENEENILAELKRLLKPNKSINDSSNED